MSAATLSPHTALATNTAAALANLRSLSDAGVLRQLDSAFAAFIAELDPNASAALAVATAMLSRMEGHGHSCLPLTALVYDDFAWPADAQPARSALWQGLPADVAGWLDALTKCETVQRIGTAADEDCGQPLVLAGPDHAPRLYLRRYWQYEGTVAHAVLARCTTSSVNTKKAREKTREWLDRLFPASAAASAPDWQKIACAIALRGHLSIITGGPGTGKTYTAARLLALLFATSADAQQLRVALAAPTGKAAARLKESIDSALGALQGSVSAKLDLAALTQRIGAARTVHALLGARPDSRRMRHHAGNPLDVDVLIVDEASMVHVEMMAALLDALPAHARLILLGDKDQLASVEAGAVFGDLCRNAEGGHYDADTAKYVLESTGEHLPAEFLTTGACPPLAQQTVMLRESRRFSGAIGELARAVNAGSGFDRPAAILRDDSTGALFHVVGADKGAPSTDAVNLAATGRDGATPSYRDYLARLAEAPPAGDPVAHAQWVSGILTAFDGFRVLCAVRNGAWGVSGLNAAIASRLARAGLLQPRGIWYPGRPVMVTRNDAALGVFNGDIGITLPGAGPGASLRVYFRDGESLRSVAVSRLAHVETAFAMTVHKSQGSEYRHTALVLAEHSGNVLTRELIYTAITRARETFSLFSERAGLLEAGVARPTRRESGLLSGDEVV